MNYACGKWLNSSSAEEDITQYFAQDNLLSKTLVEAINMIDIDAENTQQFKIRVRTFFDQCRSRRKVENRTALVKELFASLAKTFGTPTIFHVKQKTNEENIKRNLWNFLGRLHREFPSTEIFFSISVEFVVENCIGNKAVLVFNNLSWDSTRHRLNFRRVADNTRFLANILQVTLDNTEMHMQIDNMIVFEDELIKFYDRMQKVNGSNPAGMDEEISIEGTLTVEQLEQLNPRISWFQYFLGLFGNWNQNQLLTLIKDYRYFALLADLVHKFHPETIFNYIFYQSFVQLYHAILDEDFTHGNTKICSEMVMEIFKSASTRIVFDYLNLDGFEFRHDIQLIAETIFSAFRFLVYGSDWLNIEEKVAIIDKANQIKFFTGIPDWFKNDTEINQRTISVKQGASTVENFIMLAKKNFDRELNLVLGNSDPNADDEPDLVVNAYYSGMRIVLHSGWFIPPLYHPKYPLSLKYAHVGKWLGHELMHGFDTERIKEIPKGAKSWLKEDTMHIFMLKRDCLIKQYSAYCFKKQKLCLSGRRTITENMADMDGLKLAYMAYKFAIQTIGEEPPIPGFLDLTGDQLFFIALVRAQCSTGGEVERYLEDEDELHVPEKARIDVPFRNFPVFAKVFKCDVGSFYAPLQTCNIWGVYNSAEMRFF